MAEYGLSVNEQKILDIIKNVILRGEEMNRKSLERAITRMHGSSYATVKNYLNVLERLEFINWALPELVTDKAIIGLVEYDINKTLLEMINTILIQMSKGNLLDGAIQIIVGEGRTKLLIFRKIMKEAIGEEVLKAKELKAKKIQQKESEKIIKEIEETGHTLTTA